jgi:hypothetical protein
MGDNIMFGGKVDGALRGKDAFYKWLMEEHSSHDAGFDRALGPAIRPSEKWPEEHRRLRFFRVDLGGV